jgi:hypothetical protein
VNCIHCGRFIGRDGAIYIETWEMSSEIASMDGECGRCLAEDRMGKLSDRLSATPAAQERPTSTVAA